MAYSHKVAVCIIGEDGQIYNDDPSGRCKIPFGEYKIKVINKNDKRIGFDVLIGGDKVTKAGKIILGPHKSIELERWLDFESCGDKLKFVPAGSSEAKAAGKTGEFEGEVEIRIHLEKKLPEKIVEEHHHHHHYDHYWNDWWKQPYHPIWTTNTDNANITFTSSPNANITPTLYGCNDIKANYCSSGGKGMSAGGSPLMASLSEGATVKGSHSNQSFTSTYINLEEDYISIKMYLLGFTREKQMEFNFTATSGVKISEKVVKFCESCGTELSKSAKYCGNCGKKL